MLFWLTNLHIFMHMHMIETVPSLISILYKKHFSQNENCFYISVMHATSYAI